MVQPGFCFCARDTCIVFFFVSIMPRFRVYLFKLFTLYFYDGYRGNHVNDVALMSSGIKGESKTSRVLLFLQK